MQTSTFSQKIVFLTSCAYRLDVMAELNLCVCEKDIIIFTDFCLTGVQIAVLITNGRSDDEVDAAARAVADNGISLFAVGECGTWYCEFLQHPHCSGPADFI